MILFLRLRTGIPATAEIATADEDVEEVPPAPAEIATADEDVEEVSSSIVWIPPLENHHWKIRIGKPINGSVF